MPFEDFYKAEDEARRRWWKCVGAAILLYVGYWTIGLLIVPDSKPVEEPPRVRNNAASTSVRWSDVERRRRRVEELCENLPKPEKFHLAVEDIMIEDVNSTLIRYAYKSDRAWEEIMPSFLIWLNANGWKPLPSNESTFTKNNQTIAFNKVLNDLVNYEIYCSEKRDENETISFGIYE
jgi:hypothetical protein